MTATDDLIADVLVTANGEIIGRIRLQKIFYLLEQKGLGSGLAFHYHHYGPYSRELDNSLIDAQVFSGVKEDIRHRQVDGMPYSVFTLDADGAPENDRALGNIDRKIARDLIEKMKAVSSTVLELAATIHWLVKKEKVSNWQIELKRRKGIKAEQGRLDMALKLLRELDLSIA